MPHFNRCLMLTPQTIYKYELPVEGRFVLALPENAQVLTVQIQHGKPVLWALLCPGEGAVPRHFEIFGTGLQVPHLDDGSARHYVNTFQVNGGLVFHLFELTNQPA